MTTRLPTPPPSPTYPKLILCADGGGSKVCVVIRSNDGIEVRGIAGPCNIQSVGCESASQSLLLATYRALSQLSSCYLPSDLYIPPLSPNQIPPSVNSRISPDKPNGESSKASKLPNINVPLFEYAWLGCAGVQNDTDANAFMVYATQVLGLNRDRIKITNDVNLLAAPAINISGIDHVVAVVAGTGTIGRTIRVSPKASDDMEESMNIGKGKRPSLPLEDVGIARGWGYLLCDEGSAFWLGRLAIRNILTLADRYASSSIYSSPTPALLPLHRDLLEYFGTSDPADLINLSTLSNGMFDGLNIGEATAERNAVIAGSARVIFKWAFPQDQPMGIVNGLPTPPGSTNGENESDMETDVDSESEPELQLDNNPITPKPHNGGGVSLEINENEKSHQIALNIVLKGIEPLIELTINCLGDFTKIKLEKTILVLGGGLLQSNGYKKLLLNGLKKENINFKNVITVDDAAGEGARSLSKFEFGR